MKTKWYDNISVEWTDGEFERLQEILDSRAEIVEKTSAYFALSTDLKDKLKEYAEEHGYTFSELVRNVITVYAEKI